MSVPSLLFVYGSLKRGGVLHHELEELHARFLGLAKIQGELFHIKGKTWPGAFLASAQDYVQGELYKMTRPAETLKRLDEVEDLKHGLFMRRLVDAWAGNRKVKAGSISSTTRKRRRYASKAGFSAAPSGPRGDLRLRLTEHDSDIHSSQG